MPRATIIHRTGRPLRNGSEKPGWIREYYSPSHAVIRRPLLRVRKEGRKNGRKEGKMRDAQTCSEAPETVGRFFVKFRRLVNMFMRDRDENFNNVLDKKKIVIKFKVVIIDGWKRSS